MPSFQPRGLRQTEPNIKLLPKKRFPCHICQSSFTRKNDLKRHLESPTVHKNLLRNPNLQIQNPKKVIQVQPPPNLTPEIPKENFEFWENDIQPSTSQIVTPSIIP